MNSELMAFIFLLILGYLLIRLALLGLKRLYMALPLEWQHDFNILHAPLNALIIVMVLLSGQQSSLFLDVLRSDILERINEFLLFLSLSWCAIRFMSFALFNLYFIRHKKRIIPNIVSWLVRQLCYLTLLILYLHLEYYFALGDLMVMSFILLVILSITFQRPLNNIFIDFYASFAHDFQYGDFIEMDGKRGMVIESEWQHLTLLDEDDHRVFLPIKRLLDTQVSQFREEASGYRLSLAFNLSGALPPNKVRELLINTALEVNGILKDTPPDAYLDSSQGDFNHYTLICLCNEAHSIKQIKHRIFSQSWYKLHRMGLTYPFAHHPPTLSDRHSPPLQQHHIAQLLSDTEFFSPLSSSEIQHLAETAQLELYGQGERLFNQGEPGSSLYIIFSGRVSIQVSQAASPDTEVEINQLESGSVFGEISLLTGASRSANVLIMEESYLICVEKHSFQTILSHNPAIIEALTDIMVQRQTHLSQIAMNESAQQTERRHLLTSIQNFFSVK